jgi:hypothetical protein
MPHAAHPLPALIERRLDPAFERQLYVARPGLAALPSGTLAVLAVVVGQGCTMFFLLWALWWPTPVTRGQITFALSGTVVLVAIAIGIVVLLLRRHPGFALGLIRAPFIRLTVTDQRVIWSLPGRGAPLLEIARERVVGALLGAVDKRGRGNAALVLVPGDPSADSDGHIHFDRLPRVERFVAALQR